VCLSAVHCLAKQTLPLVASAERKMVRDLRVQYRNREIVVPATDSVEEILDILERETDVPKGKIKLVGKGGVKIEQFNLLTDSGSDLGSSLKMFGSTRVELAQIELAQEAATEERVRNDLDVDYDVILKQRSSAAELRHREQRLAEVQAAPYRFDRIRVLEQFKDHAKAREILEELAADYGFHAVLKKNRWKVGVLAEMFPKGQVGVDPVCVLGFNVNKGAEISLRLRTDDLRGFRKIAEVRKVLCHELAHMVHSEHDAKFYQLMREIERDIVELDWSRSQGARLGGESKLTSNVLVSNSPVASVPQEVRRLGGDSIKESNATPRELAAQAAASRLTHEHDQAVPINCDCSHHTALKPSSAAKEPLIASSGERCDPEGLKTNENTNEPHLGPQQQVSVQQQPPPAVPPSLCPPNLETEHEHVASFPPENLNETTTEVANQGASQTPVFDLKTATPAASSVSPDPADEWPLPHKAQKTAIERAVAQVLERNPPDIAVHALTMLETILRNIERYPTEKKYQKIRVSNRKFQDSVGRALGGANVLRQSGWSMNEGALVLVESNERGIGECVFALAKVQETLDIAFALQ